jgi:hypothetical protein
MRVSVSENKNGTHMEVHAENCGHLRFVNAWDKPFIHAKEFNSMADTKNYFKNLGDNEQVLYKISPCLNKGEN